MSLFLTGLLVFPVQAEVLHVNGTWQFSDNSSGNSSDRQTYSVSYFRDASITDLVRIGGTLRYNKTIDTDNNASDLVSSSFNLNNANDIYIFSFTGSYDYRNDENQQSSQLWSWRSHLRSSWANPLWPGVALYYGKDGGEIEGESKPGSDNAGISTNWGYFPWLRLFYGVDWKKNSTLNDQEYESVRQTASLNTSKGFWDNRASFSFGQFYSRTDDESTDSVNSEGFALRPGTISQVYYEENNDPFSNAPVSPSNDVTFLVTPAPGTLEINPDTPPSKQLMNIILHNGNFEDIEAANFYTTEDIDSFAGNISWKLYEGSNGTDDWTFVANLLPEYDPVEQRFEFDFGSTVKREYIKFVADPSALLPWQVTYLEKIEVFDKISGSGSTVTTKTDTENWKSTLGMGFRLSDTVRLSYGSIYNVTENRNNRKSKSLTNNGSVSWAPSQYFQTRLNASENRLDIDDSKDSMNRRYGLSLTSHPLATLDLSAGVSRNENYLDSNLDAATHNYSLGANAQLYRDLQAGLTFNYFNPRTGGASDTFNSSLDVAARLAPALLLSWTSSYNQVIDTSDYTFNNSFALNWRVSAILNTNANLDTTYGSGRDLGTRLTLNMGITPNIKHRLNLGYTIDDSDEDLIQTATANWRWIISSVFNLSVTGNYLLADENTWSVLGTLNAQLSNQR